MVQLESHRLTGRAILTLVAPRPRWPTSRSCAASAELGPRAHLWWRGGQLSRGACAPNSRQTRRWFCAAPPQRPIGSATPRPLAPRSFVRGHPGDQAALRAPHSGGALLGGKQPAPNARTGAFSIFTWLGRHRAEPGLGRRCRRAAGRAFAPRWRQAKAARRCRKSCRSRLRCGTTWRAPCAPSCRAAPVSSSVGEPPGRLSPPVARRRLLARSIGRPSLTTRLLAILDTLAREKSRPFRGPRFHCHPPAARPRHDPAPPTSWRRWPSWRRGPVPRARASRFTKLRAVGGGGGVVDKGAYEPTTSARAITIAPGVRVRKIPGAKKRGAGPPGRRVHQRVCALARRPELVPLWSPAVAKRQRGGKDLRVGLLRANTP